MSARGASLEFRVGVRSCPYLADHGFQDMVVLPGAAFVEMALRTSRGLFGRVPRRLRNIIFQHPIILTDEDTFVRMDVRNLADGSVECGFYEAPNDRGDEPARQYAATLEIDWASPACPDAVDDRCSIEAFQARSAPPIHAPEFYEALRRNGNQYGPRFQRVSSLWRAGDQAVARLSVTPHDSDTEREFLDPSLLDAMAQVMAPLIMEKGKTLVLRSIESIEIREVAFPETLWGHARLRVDDNRAADVHVFDESGRTFVALSGVSFGMLNVVDAADVSAALNLVVASNFTAEPLEDGLMFWGDHFGASTHVEFAPYNQIFQQLLGNGSALRRNNDGVNAILLSLEEWAADKPRMALDPIRAERCFGDRTRYVLRNGLEIVHLNQYETDYLYNEIFEGHCYLKHGIRLHDGDVVVDIGANIGLFSLFVLSRCANPQIYAFEPAPAVYDLLKANCDAYGANVRTFNVGVSDKPETATLTFYQQSSVFSGFHADEADDREAIHAVVRNTLTSEMSIDAESAEACVRELMIDRLRHSTHQCQLTSVSEIIRENDLDRINLLKIDAEKSELDIIAGIGDDDWDKIDQIVIEIHDRTGQVVHRIQRLLIEHGYRCAVEQESLLEHSGLFNLYATRRDSAHDQMELQGAGLQRRVQEFTTALRSFMSGSAAPLILCLCPRTPAAQQDTTLKAALDEAEQRLLAECGAFPRVHTIGSALLLSAYPVADYYDPDGHRLGHVPYTPDGYAAIGAALVRAIFNLNRRPFKVIALDCDNTLWKGVCGEDGSLGIDVTPHHRAVQEFMVDQMNAGMLLCLCSKNNEQDVLDVFDRRPDMVLRREHIVSRRINWNSKSANIKSLADELNIGLDSFILVDDSPVDCADVRLNCPGVLTVQLPPNPNSFLSFLNHVWAFDRLSTTDEDRNRTRLYRAQAERQQFREEAPSLKDFIAGLQLRVEIAEATDAQFGRVSQLTFRTNQFNLTTIRRSEDEIRRIVARDHATCLVVRVADRFGDYGLAGAVMYEKAADRYTVDTFLLSCRVLGRGVEHAVVAHIGERAAREGIPTVQFTYLRTGRNVPAQEFLSSLGEQYRDESGASWTFPASYLAGLTYDPDRERFTSHRTVQPAARLGVLDRPDRLQRIGEHLHDIGQISKAIENYRIRQHPRAYPADWAAGSTVESAIASIWSKVLGRSHIGLNENFFEAGGTSLRAVQVISSIKKELNETLSIVTLFECPTVALLAARLRPASAETHSETAISTAALRGRHRRDRTVRRRAS